MVRDGCEGTSVPGDDDEEVQQSRNGVRGGKDSRTAEGLGLRKSQPVNMLPSEVLRGQKCRKQTLGSESECWIMASSTEV